MKTTLSYPMLRVCATVCLVLSLRISASPFTNGSFELPGNLPQNSSTNLSNNDTRLAGWFSIGGIAYVNGLAGLSFPPVDGSYHLIFTGQNLGGSSGMISQTFDTVANQDYVLTFFVGRISDLSLYLTARVFSEGQDFVPATDYVIFNAWPPPHGYARQQFRFTAKRATTTLQFLGGNGAYALDDVTLDAVDGLTLAPTNLQAPTTTGPKVGLGTSIVPAPPGLIGWWPGDGNAKDLAGGNTGIIVNAKTVPGYIGEAFTFSGQNSYVQIPNSPAINSISNALSLEAWIWHDATGATVQRYVTLTADQAVVSYDNGPVRFELHLVNPQALVPLRSDMTVEPRTWYHVAGTYDGSEMRLYVNGVRVGVAVVNRPTGWSPGNSELGISSPGQAMNGLIDEVAVYSRALTTAEIQSHFEAGSAGMAKVPIFSAMGVVFPGTARLSIKGLAGKAVTIEGSTNLIDWVTLTTDPNATGTVNFNDSAAGGFSRRFYRAVSK